MLVNQLKHRISFPEEIIVPEPHHLKPLLLQVRLSILVVPFFANMAFAVQFDDQPRHGTEEVNNVRPDGLLAAELQTAETLLA